jgi:hypothetical protein
MLPMHAAVTRSLPEAAHTSVSRCRRHVINPNTLVGSYWLKLPSAETLQRVVEGFLMFLSGLLATGQPPPTVITVEEPPAGVTVTMDHALITEPPGLLPERLNLLMAAASVGNVGAVQRLLKAGAL